MSPVKTARKTRKSKSPAPAIVKARMKPAQDIPFKTARKTRKSKSPASAIVKAPMKPAQDILIPFKTARKTRKSKSPSTPRTAADQSTAWGDMVTLVQDGLSASVNRWALMRASNEYLTASLLGPVDAITFPSWIKVTQRALNSLALIIEYELTNLLPLLIFDGHLTSTDIVSITDMAEFLQLARSTMSL
jgi:hypothetical protein